MYERKGICSKPKHAWGHHTLAGRKQIQSFSIANMVLPVFLNDNEDWFRGKNKMSRITLKHSEDYCLYESAFWLQEQIH